MQLASFEFECSLLRIFSIYPFHLQDYFNTPMFTLLLDKSGNGFAASYTSLLITSFDSVLAFVAHKLQNFELCECKSGREGGGVVVGVFCISSHGEVRMGI